MAKTNHNHLTNLRIWNRPVYQTEKWRKKGRGKYQVKRKKSFRKPFRKPFLAKSQNFVINRYPLLACIGYEIAKQKYPETLSKSLGIALANQYAAWKNARGGFGALKTGIQYPKAEVKEKWEFEGKINIIQFCGETFVEKNGIIIGAYYRKIWTTAKSKDFDYKVISAFNRIKKNGFDFICQKIGEELEKEKEISDGFIDAPFGKHFFQFWKKVRDKLRSKEVWR